MARRFVIVGNVGSGAGRLIRWLATVPGIVCTQEMPEFPPLSAPPPAVLKACVWDRPGAEACGLLVPYEKMEIVGLRDEDERRALGLVVHVRRNPIACFSAQRSPDRPLWPSASTRPDLLQFARISTKASATVERLADLNFDSTDLRHDPRAVVRTILRRLDLPLDQVPLRLNGCPMGPGCRQRIELYRQSPNDLKALRAYLD